MTTGYWLGRYFLWEIHPPFLVSAGWLLPAPEGDLYAVGTTASDLTTATNARNQDAGDPFINRIRLVPCDDGTEPNDWPGQALDWRSRRGTWVEGLPTAKED